MRELEKAVVAAARRFNAAAALDRGALPEPEFSALRDALAEWEKARGDVVGDFITARQCPDCDDTLFDGADCPRPECQSERARAAAILIPIEATVHKSADAMADHVQRMFPKSPRPIVHKACDARCAARGGCRYCEGKPNG